MISPEADILHQCFISYRNVPETRPQEDITKQVFIGDRIDTCLNKKSLQDTSLTNLEVWGVIEKKEVEWCSSCGAPAEICDSASHTYHNRIEYRLSAENFIEKWFSWVELNTNLRFSGVEKKSETIWHCEVNFFGTDIVLKCFFAVGDLKEYDFEPQRLEFGIGFFDREFLPDEDYLFSWTALLEDPQQSRYHFDNRLQNLVTVYRDAISARLVDTASLDKPSRRKIRSKIWDFLNNTGYASSREISDNIYCHNKYGIEPKGDDFVATRDSDSEEIAILVCRCDKGGGSYHLHRFENQAITSVESDSNLNHALETIDKNVDTYLQIQKRKDQSTSLTNIFAAVAALLSTLLFADGVVNAFNVFQNLIPEEISIPAEITAFLLLLNIIILVGLAIVLLKPYWDGIRFSWDIPTDE